LFRSNDEALIDELGRAEEKLICSKLFTSTIRHRGFFISFAEAADFSDILLNIRIYAAQITTQANRDISDLALISRLEGNGMEDGVPQCFTIQVFCPRLLEISRLKGIKISISSCCTGDLGGQFQ
jgi:hypothetical protein